MKPYEKPSPQECLMHYGILGMKWGVRRFQNEDGSLTAAGRKRYDVNIEGAKKKVTEAVVKEKEAVKAYNKATLGGTIYSERAQRNLDKATLNTRLAKKDLSSEKIKASLNKEKGRNLSTGLNLKKSIGIKV